MDPQPEPAATASSDPHGIPSESALEGNLATPPPASTWTTGSASDTGEPARPSAPAPAVTGTSEQLAAPATAHGATHDAGPAAPSEARPQGPPAADAMAVEASSDPVVAGTPGAAGAPGTAAVAPNGRSTPHTAEVAGQPAAPPAQAASEPSTTPTASPADGSGPPVFEGSFEAKPEAPQVLDPLAAENRVLAGDEALTTRTDVAPVGGRDAAAHEARLERAAENVQLESGRPSPEAIARAERILNQVRLQLRPELSQAVVELEPASLGRIAIQVEVEDGELAAMIRAERPETLAVLERHLPELRAMLQSTGVDVTDLELALGFASEGDTGFEQTGEGGRDGAAAHAVESDAEAAVESALASRISEHGVDTYA